MGRKARILVPQVSLLKPGIKGSNNTILPHPFRSFIAKWMGKHEPQHERRELREAR
jgi:hypothetical protein